jgi:hypothetical protein
MDGFSLEKLIFQSLRAFMSLPVLWRMITQRSILPCSCPRVVPDGKFHYQSLSQDWRDEGIVIHGIPLDRENAAVLMRQGRAAQPGLW